MGGCWVDINYQLTIVLVSGSGSSSGSSSISFESMRSLSSVASALKQLILFVWI